VSTTKGYMSNIETKAKIATAPEFSAQANNKGVEKERGDATVRRTGVTQRKSLLTDRVIPGGSFAPGIPKGTPSGSFK
jgi:hypothetical protein